MNNGFSKGMMIAASAAALLASGALRAGDAKPKAEATVHCYGINSCKGKGACGSPANNNACAGTNACKGKGWIEVSAKTCNEKKGKILDAPPASAPKSAASSA